MSRPKRDFVDVLDVWLETASEDDIRGALASIAVWSRVRKFKFRVRVEPIKIADAPLLDAAEGVRCV